MAPTSLDRIQTLLQPDAFAKVRTLAKHNRRALSAMSAELVEEALKLPKYKQQIEDAEIQVPMRDDPRTDIKQVAIVKTMRPGHYQPREEAPAKPRVDHKGYLMKDDYGNVLIEDTKPTQTIETSGMMEYVPSTEQVDPEARVEERLRQMEEMMVKMQQMMQR